MTYFEGWFFGSYVIAEDWYEDNLIYVNVKCWHKSTALSRPDEDKSFLLKLDKPEQIASYKYSIAACLSSMKEQRDGNGCLIPINLELPQIDLAKV